MNEKLSSIDIQNMAIQRAKEIFTAENLAAITFHLHSLIPYQDARVGETEYLTVVAAARIDGMRELVELIIKNVK